MLAISVLVALIAIVVGVGSAGGGAAPATPPNVLLIVSDDQPVGMVGRGMPFLDRANGWTKFDRYFDNNPLCCPTRATLLTGLYSHNHGVETNLVANQFKDGATLATALDAAGYQTGLFGKYLNDYPWKKGARYVPPGWDEWAAFAKSSGYFDYTLLERGGQVRYGGAPGDYSTDVLAERTASFIDSASGPFFAYFSPYAPHSPRTPAPRHEGSMRKAKVKLPGNFDRIAKGAPSYWTRQPRPDAGEIKKAIRDEWETLRAVDEAIERFVDVLAADGKLEQTVIIFLSDNGYSFGSHRNPQKDCLYEECVHLPLHIRWPGGAQAKVGALVSDVDIAPTIAEVAGIELPRKPDGESLVPLIEGETNSLRRPVLLRHKHYPKTPPSFWGIRTERWKYGVQANGERELYDLERDRLELRNLAEQRRYKGVVKKLAKQMRALRRG